MEKIHLKNKLERMEKLLNNQKSQQNKMSENYFNMVKTMIELQKNNTSDKGKHLHRITNN